MTKSCHSVSTSRRIFRCRWFDFRSARNKPVVSSYFHAFCQSTYCFIWNIEELQRCKRVSVILHDGWTFRALGACCSWNLVPHNVALCLRNLACGWNLLRPRFMLRRGSNQPGWLWSGCLYVDGTDSYHVYVMDWNGQTIKTLHPLSYLLGIQVNIQLQAFYFFLFYSNFTKSVWLVILNEQTFHIKIKCIKEYIDFKWIETTLINDALNEMLYFYRSS